MSRNNDIFQVLVTKGDQALPSAGTALGDLSPNQIGVFDANTNLALDGSVKVREFYLAVGVDRDGDNVIETVKKSAGQVIQTENIRFLDYKPHTPARPMILEIKDYKVSCDTDYSLKLEFRNQEIYRLQGTNQFTHSYAIKTECCDACETCGEGDCNEITKLMKAAINADPEGLVYAEAIALTDLTTGGNGTSTDYTAGDVISDADVDAIIANNQVPEVIAAGEVTCTGLRLTSRPVAVNAFCSINLKYFKARQTVMIPSLGEGFGCNGSVEVTQQPVFEQGLGYDIMQKEYVAGGWYGNPGVYRTSGTNHVAIGTEYFAEKTVAYDQFALTYDQRSIAGWLEHFNNLATIVAVPGADMTTRNSLATVLDGLMPTGFDGILDDTKVADEDPTVVENMSDETADTDGVA